MYLSNLMMYKTKAFIIWFQKLCLNKFQINLAHNSVGVAFEKLRPSQVFDINPASKMRTFFRQKILTLGTYGWSWWKRYLEKLGIPRQNQLHENCSVNSKKSIFCHSSSEGQVTDMVVWPGLCSSALAWFFPGLQTFLNKLFLTKGEWLYFFTLPFAFSTLRNVNVNTGLSFLHGDY